MAKTASSKAKTGSRFNLFRILTSPVSSINKEKESTVENLALLLNSGVDILNALRLVRYDIRSQRMLELIDDIAYEIDSGSTLWAAFKKYKMLPSYMIALLRIGEETGRLPENLKIIVDQQKKNKLFKSKLISAMIYPAVIMVLSIIIGIGIFIFVIPRLASVYNALDIELPFITRFMLDSGVFLSNYGIIIIPAVLILLYGSYYFFFVREKSKHIGQRAVFQITPIRNVILNIEIARFGFLFGTLIGAGLPILDALESLARSSGFVIYRDFYVFLFSEIQSGETFKEAFAAYKNINKIFPVPIQQIIVAAENSGKLEQSLMDIGVSFEQRIDTSTRNLAVLFEPIMLIIVWIGVVFVALSVIFPVYNLVGGVSQSTRQQQNGNESEDTNSGVLPVIGVVRIVNTVDRANVLAKPEVDSVIIDVVRSGQTFQYNLEQNGYYQIILSEQRRLGWIPVNLVELVPENEQD